MFHICPSQSGGMNESINNHNTMTKYIMNPKADKDQRIKVGEVVVPHSKPGVDDLGVDLPDDEAKLLLSEGSIVKVGSKESKAKPVSIPPVRAK